MSSAVLGEFYSGVWSNVNVTDRVFGGFGRVASGASVAVQLLRSEQHRSPVFFSTNAKHFHSFGKGNIE